MSLHFEFTSATNPTTTRRGGTAGHDVDNPWHRSRRRIRSALTLIRGDLAIGLAVGAGLAAAWGMVTGLVMPRGPMTAGQVLLSVVLSVLVGMGAGWLTASRWSVLATTASFIAVVELTRSGLVGPTVEGFHPSFFGLMAFVGGRGVHGLVSVAPMVLSALTGAAMAQRSLAVSPHRHPVRRVLMILATMLLAGVVLLLVRPASTASITDGAGDPIAGSIATLTSVEVNGHEQALMIRGVDQSNPVLLFLAGGPGGTELGAMRRHLVDLENHFVVVTWDQRGSGKSYPALDPTSTLTVRGAIDDTIAVTDYLRERFDEDRIYLAGQSWGTTLGVLAVQERPDMYRAFIGSGQMVDQLATDLIFYEDAVTWALRTGRTDLLTDLVSTGPPPYGELHLYEQLFGLESDLYPYDHGGNSEGSGQMAENIFVPEYSLLDQMHILAGVADSFSVLYPQLQGIDFRETATEFEVPMFFVQGAHEAGGRAELFDEWYPMIEAPIKDVVTLDTSGHRPLWEQPGEFVDYLVDTVLPATS